MNFNRPGAAPTQGSNASWSANQHAQATLNSIGDAVITTDLACRITFLNAVAGRLTGWSHAEALGHRIEEVFLPVDCSTRKPLRNSMELAMTTQSTVILPPNCIIVRRDGSICAIEDSAAPIRNEAGHLTGAVLVFRDVSEARAVAKRLAYSAGHDALTDLPNRGVFNDRLVQTLSLARRRRHKVAVLYLDLDRFKRVNDAFGHAVGDRLLQSVAARLRRCVRDSDTAARQGGDEFVVLLPCVTQAQDAALVANQMLQSLSMPHDLHGHGLQITVSIGIAAYPDHGGDALLLVSRADSAMYQVKSGGGNRYEFFNPSCVPPGATRAHGAAR